MNASSVFRTLRPKHSWVTRYFWRQWKLIAVLAAFLVLTVGFQLGTPLLLRAFLDAVSAQAAIGIVLRVAAIYIVARYNG
ncbi:hypothetical protein BH10CHL1_BH10CHL1_31300 [soil metagenome]